LSVSIYNWLRHDHPAVNLRASTKSLGILQHLSMEAPTRDDRVRWLVSASYVGRLVVSGPEMGTAKIILPLPKSQCRAIVAKVGGSCSPGGHLSLSSPVTFAWSNPQLINSTDDRQVASTSVNIASSGARPGALSVTLLAQTNARPSLCFSSPFQPQPVTLTVTSRQGQFSFPFSGYFPGFVGINHCADGLPVFVGSTGSGFPPALEFEEIRTLRIRAWATAGNLQGFAGEIDLDPGETTVLGHPTIVSLRSSKTPPLVASLRINPQGRILTVRSKAATSVITNSGQLVPSAWAQNTDFLVPLLGGLLSVLVINPLTVSTQMLMDAMKRCRGPIQWWRGRRARKRRKRSQKKEVRHAT